MNAASATVTFSAILAALTLAFVGVGALVGDDVTAAPTTGYGIDANS